MAATDAESRALCDALVEGAAEMMVLEGATFAMVVDRLITYATAQIVSMEGRARAVEVLRGVADQVEHGGFASVEHAGAVN